MVVAEEVSATRYLLTFGATLVLERTINVFHLCNHPLNMIYNNYNKQLMENAARTYIY